MHAEVVCDEELERYRQTNRKASAKDTDLVICLDETPHADDMSVEVSKPSSASVTRCCERIAECIRDLKPLYDVSKGAVAPLLCGVLLRCTVVLCEQCMQVALYRVTDVNYRGWM